MVRHIDLKEVLNRTGVIKDNIDKAKWRTGQGVISVTGQKFINWSDGGYRWRRCNRSDHSFETI